MATYPLLLILRHTEYDHFEEWFDAGYDQIFVASNCPSNYPTNISHYMTSTQALRQYALMTSTEGWAVLEDHGWHDHADALEVE